MIAGLGGLSYQQAAALARKGGIVLLLLWTIGVATVLLMPLAFPNWKTASFFSASLIQQTPTFNFLSLYIPANPFYPLSNNIVPAVVVFSVFVGIALIGIGDKGTLLNNLGVCINALGRVTGWIVRLAPLGVFAIIASATGTMRLPDLQRRIRGSPGSPKSGSAVVFESGTLPTRCRLHLKPRWGASRIRCRNGSPSGGGHEGRP